MKDVWKILLSLFACLFLLGSFPVRHYWGQAACDVVRSIGFVLLFINNIILFLGLKKNS